jgi:predicted transcriptional regulator
MTDAIFLIKPHFADAILDGSKIVELRKVVPKRPV